MPRQVCRCTMDVGYIHMWYGCTRWYLGYWDLNTSLLWHRGLGVAVSNWARGRALHSPRAPQPVPLPVALSSCGRAQFSICLQAGIATPHNNRTYASSGPPLHTHIHTRRPPPTRPTTSRREGGMNWIHRWSHPSRGSSPLSPSCPFAVYCAIKRTRCYSRVGVPWEEPPSCATRRSDPTLACA